MTEEKLNITDISETDASAAALVTGTEKKDSLGDAVKLIHKTERESETKKQSRENNTERANDSAIKEMKAKMAENAERAAALAIERSIALEYGGEYRQRLAKRTVKQEKIQREELLKKEREELERNRELEIKAYLEGEAEEAKIRAERAKNLIFSLNEVYENKSAHTETESSVSDAALFSEKTVRTEENTDTCESVCKNSGEGKILLNINPVGLPFVQKSEKETSEEPILLTIGQRAPGIEYPYNLEFYRDAEPAVVPNAVTRHNVRIGVPVVDGIRERDGVIDAEEDFLREEYVKSGESISAYSEMLYGRLEKSAENSEIKKDSKTSLEAELFAEYERRFGGTATAEEEIERQYSDVYPSYVGSAEENIPFGQDEEYRKYDAHIKDERAIIGYEKSQAKKIEENEHSDEYSEIDERYHSLHGYKSEECNRFHKAELSKKINKYHKEEASLAAKMKKLSARQEDVTKEENTLLIVEKIGVAKELTELTVDLLVFCVYADVRFKIAKYKRLLEEKISDYNALCDEYEAATGRPVVRLSAEMANDVVAGRICEPIPNVYYSGDASFGAYDEVNTVKFIEKERAARLSEEEVLVDEVIERTLSGDYHRELTKAENKLAEKRKAAEMSKIRYASERALLLNALREEYRLSAVEKERDILLNSFEINEKGKARKIRSLDKKISKIKSEARRSAKIEKENSARYYMLYAMGTRDEKTKKGARGERLESMRTRLDILLAERERNAETLIALYGGTDRKLREAKINRKARAVRKKYAKMMYRQQRNTADRVAAMKAPLDLKEKVYSLFNKKTLAVSTIEESTYKLKRLKPTGRAKRELVVAIKRSKAELRRLNADIKYLMKKIRKHHEKYIDDRKWGVMLVVCVLILALSFVAYYLFGDAIMSFVKKWLLGG